MSSDTQDAKRYRALRLHLKVVSDDPDSYSRWLELDVVPFRSKAEEVDAIVDQLVKVLQRRGESL